MKSLLEYFILKTSASPDFNRKLRQILAPNSKSKIGILFSERLINMPIEIVPPMYRMLVDELAKVR